MANVTVGRGKLWIAPWTGSDYDTPPASETFVFIGNCPEINLEMEEDVLEHPDYTSGLRSIDEEISIEARYTGSFITDVISNANLLKFFRGTESGDEIRAMQSLEVRYALKFISNNPRGANRTFLCQKVKLVSGGALSLVADEWQQLSFSFKGLKSAYAGHTGKEYIVITNTTTTTTTTTTT
jgi:hypothetical protein